MLSKLKEVIPSSSVYFSPLNAAMVKFDVVTNERAAAFLAHVCVDTDGFEYIEGQPVAEDEFSLGNESFMAISAASSNYTTAYSWFRPRGLLKLRGFDEYKNCGKALGIDLISMPNLLLTPNIACEAAGWKWSKSGCNALMDAGFFSKTTEALASSVELQTSRDSLFFKLHRILQNET